MLNIVTRANQVRVGDSFHLNFQRTLRVPDTGKVYNLPAGLGNFELHRVEDYADRVPERWRQIGGLFTVMHEREAMWINFGGTMQHAVKVAYGKVNAVSGKEWQQGLIDHENDYLVAPRPQYWLDGINFGDGIVRQIVAVRMGQGRSVEEQVTGKAEHGGIQIIVYAPKPEFWNTFAERSYVFGGGTKNFSSTITMTGTTLQDNIAYTASDDWENTASSPTVGRYSRSLPKTMVERDGLSAFNISAGYEMGVGAGGKISQKIYSDKYGVGHWDQTNYGRFFLHICSPELYREITGLTPHPEPTQLMYRQYNIPWFTLNDAGATDVAAPEVLKKVKSQTQIDMDEGKGKQDNDHNMDSHPVQLPHNETNGKIVRDGDW